MTPKDDSYGVARRSGLSWLAIICRLLAGAGFLVALLHQSGPRWALAGVAVGLLLLPLAWRRKASPAAGATWSASADLVEDRKHAPGELSFTPDALVWTPSSHSVRNGYEELVVPLTSRANVTRQAGPALLDVFVDVRGPVREARFLTGRSSRLRRVVRQLPG